jgi:hypothetical protein
MKRAVIAALSLAPLTFAAPAFAGGADDLAASFCATRLKSDAEAVKPMLTPSLLAIIKDAEERNDIIAKGNPDEKPPLGDGVPYQSFPDVPEVCEPGTPVERAGLTEVPLKYSFKDSPDAGWTDTLILSDDDGKLLINDVHYQGSADGSAIVGLREVLNGAFDQ